MIGVFDSGVGGLSVLRHIHAQLPEYSTIYIGDSANWPYGTKTHEEITNFTWAAVRWLFKQGCPLVILACNSASSQALRIIQQTKLGGFRTSPHPSLEKEGKRRGVSSPFQGEARRGSEADSVRVLGVIRPTVEALAEKYDSIGVLATPVTVASKAYVTEFQKIKPTIKVSQQACPSWVSFVEEGKVETPEAQSAVNADVEDLLTQSPDIQAVLLGCTHYPALMKQIRKAVPDRVEIFDQGPLVAKSLEDYLKRHSDVEKRIDASGQRQYYTTGDAQAAASAAKHIFGQSPEFMHVDLS